MHPPEQHADPVGRTPGKAHVPEQRLPVERIAFPEKWRPEEPALGVVALAHELLQLVPRNQLMEYSGAGKMPVVAPHAHQLVRLGHRVGRIGDLHYLAAEEEWRRLLRLGGQHGHPPVSYTHLTLPT